MAHGPAVWLPFVQPFGTVFLGIGAFAIAYRQWRTANNKVRVDLFDRRFTEYAETLKIFDRLNTKSGLSEKDIGNLTILQRRSRLFFGADYVLSLGKNVIQVEQVLVALRDNNPDQAELLLERIRQEN